MDAEKNRERDKMTVHLFTMSKSYLVNETRQRAETNSSAEAATAAEYLAKLAILHETDKFFEV